MHYFYLKNAGLLTILQYIKYYSFTMLPISTWTSYKNYWNSSSSHTVLVRYLNLFNYHIIITVQHYYYRDHSNKTDQSDYRTRTMSCLNSYRADGKLIGWNDFSWNSLFATVPCNLIGHLYWSVPGNSSVIAVWRSLFPICLSSYTCIRVLECGKLILP